jgi:Uma2 family endonuclease
MMTRDQIMSGDRLAMSIQEKLYTAAELWELSHQPEYRDKRLELSEGRLIEMSLSGWEASNLAYRIGLLMGMYVEPRNLGEITGADGGYIIRSETGKNTVFAPDVAFVSADRIPAGGLTVKYAPIMPDLAVEIISPNDTLPEVEEKVDEYLRAGTRMVIVVHPKNKIIYVYTPNSTQRLKLDDTLDGGEVLPGFSVTVREIFKL